MEQTSVDDIKNRLSKIKNLNATSATIDDYSALINEICAGMSLDVPVLQKGGLIYRGRIVFNKPNNLEELIQPKSEYVKKLGRANNIGESMFYGTVGLAMPFFEIGAQKDDLVVISRYTVERDLRLAHIGFTNEVGNHLNSSRKLSDIFDFVTSTVNRSNVNAEVYNLISELFSRKVDDLNEYKISNAIARLFLSEPIEALMYPTIAMDGNSENIVLKPEISDESFRFQAVELIKIVSVQDKSYKIKHLDSAVDLGRYGEILWTGMGLSTNVEPGENVTYEVGFGEWIGKNSDGVRKLFKSDVKLYPNASELEETFRKSGHAQVKFTMDFNVTSPIGTVIKCAMSYVYDFAKKVKYLNFYIDTPETPENLLFHFINDQAKRTEMEDYVKGREIIFQVPDNPKLSSSELIFSSEIYIYSEYYFDLSLLTRKSHDNRKVHAFFGIKKAPIIYHYLPKK